MLTHLKNTLNAKGVHPLWYDLVVLVFVWCLSLTINIYHLPLYYLLLKRAVPKPSSTGVHSCRNFKRPQTLLKAHFPQQQSLFKANFLISFDFGGKKNKNVSPQKRNISPFNKMTSNKTQNIVGILEKSKNKGKK